MEFFADLEKGVNDLGLKLSSSQIDQLTSYIQLIQKWNKAYNLVGTSNSRELVKKHILDCLTVVAFIEKTPVLDVGSGAGLPGIPLAISLPGISFTLLDSNGKKTRFMRQVVMELNLTNVEIVQTRIEDYQPSEAPKTVLSRAFAPLDKALEMLAAVCAPHGQIQIMLGTKATPLPQITGIKDILVHTLTVPDLSSDRHLLIANK